MRNQKSNPKGASVPKLAKVAPNKAWQFGDGRFRVAFESAPFGMAIVGLDYKLRKVNRFVCTSFGYTEEELLARTWAQLTHPDDVKKGMVEGKQLLSGEIPSYRLEKRFLAKDGTLVWLDFTAVLIRGGDNEPLYTLVMADDITERKLAEEALRTSDERYRSFVINSSEAIWRFEVERPVDTKIPADEQIALIYKYGYLAECNDALARMCGHDRADDLVGARFGEIALASNPANVSTLRSFIANNYRLHEAKTEAVNFQGERKFFSSNIVGIVLNECLLRIWGTQRDETEAIVADAAVKQSRQQLRALAAYLQDIREKERSDIAREMHDVLGQSLTALKIDLAWLAKRLRESDSEGDKVLMGQKLSAATSLLEETIGVVKTLSTELRPGVLDKFGLPAAVEWQCQEFERRTGVKCKLRLPDKEAVLNNDVATTIFRILQEALTNVSRHADARHVDIRLEIDSREVCLIVKDDGRGITSAQLEAPDSLGLLGMRERTELLGGSLEVKPESPRGTCVSARIPLAVPEALKAIV